MLRYKSALALAIALAAVAAQARVISYAPYTDKPATPAIQNRLNRHFVLIEGNNNNLGIIVDPPPPYGVAMGQLVVYDTSGQEEPRVVYPRAGLITFDTVAVHEDAVSGRLDILVGSFFDPDGKPLPNFGWYLSTDGGRTWTKVALPEQPQFTLYASGPDIGGPFARSRYQQVRIGNAAAPFVIAMRGPYSTVFSVRADGSVKLLYTGQNSLVIAGTDRSGGRYLVCEAYSKFSIVDSDGNVTPLGNVASIGSIDGWVTPDGGAYVEVLTYSSTTGNVSSIYYLKGDTATLIGTAPLSNEPQLFAVPTADYSGAWLITRGAGKPTSLLLHTPLEGTVKQWDDASGPKVEALHAGRSGNTLLLQVHRPRAPADQRLFLDPAIAIWHKGEGAPQAYDELYMNESFNKGFVHLDVDYVASGERFVFDSGSTPGGDLNTSPPPPSGGGSDVVQEWGVVHASLQQRLFIPGIGRTPGAYGSFWKSDVILYNPDSAATNVSLFWLANGVDPRLATLPHAARVTLAPKEIRLLEDVLKSTFNIESGSGALSITPDQGRGVTVTSRTYNTASNGTYGFGMNAIDVETAASSRFPVTFSGAFLGADFRTNLVLTSTRGIDFAADLTPAHPADVVGTAEGPFTFAGISQQQFNTIAPLVGFGPTDTGALMVRPARGELVASVFTIDNRTNDPTYFPPDLPAETVRTIPAIGYLDGANGAKFRSDLYLYNPAAVDQSVTMQMKMWDSADNKTVTLLLLPHEARVIRQALPAIFGRTGIARLRYQSQRTDVEGVRITSRTYSEDLHGGTYGFLMPPLNNFQSGSAGDTLEILGTRGGSGFRTNLGLVDMAAFAGPILPTVRIDIIDGAGETIDSFITSNIPPAGGMQINDLFHARNLGDGPAAPLIRVTVLSGMVGAYATTLDNGTNDSMYVAANLGAAQ